nr:MAG: hypothetical protein DIU78_10230 [Pseudomonadota bacterium]
MPKERPKGRGSAAARAFALGDRGLAGPVCVGLLVTGVATALSYGLPEAHAATGVGIAFLVATYGLVLHASSTAAVRSFGLSLGGLLEPEPLAAARLARAFGTSLAWAAVAALVTFPPFVAGYVLWNAPTAPFTPAPLPALATDVLGQIFGVALPEEAFFRGYLQNAFDRALPPRRRFLGAPLGPGVVLSSALFALGHLLTAPDPGRLAVFFPSLVFGFLRARTGGIGAAVLFHAACNLFASYLGQSYGLLP